MQYDLWARLGVESRAGRRLIHILRKDEDCPILTGPGGYYLPSKDNGIAEARQFVRMMTRQAVSTFAALKAAKKYLQANDQQIEILEAAEVNQHEPAAD